MSKEKQQFFGFVNLLFVWHHQKIIVFKPFLKQWWNYSCLYWAQFQKSNGIHIIVFFWYVHDCLIRIPRKELKSISNEIKNCNIFFSFGIGVPLIILQITKQCLRAFGVKLLHALEFIFDISTRYKFSYLKRNIIIRLDTIKIKFTINFLPCSNVPTRACACTHPWDIITSPVFLKIRFAKMNCQYYGRIIWVLSHIMLNADSARSNSSEPIDFASMNFKIEKITLVSARANVFSKVAAIAFVIQIDPAVTYKLYRRIPSNSTEDCSFSMTVPSASVEQLFGKVKHTSK